MPREKIDDAYRRGKRNQATPMILVVLRARAHTHERCAGEVGAGGGVEFKIDDAATALLSRVDSLFYLYSLLKLPRFSEE